MVLKHEIRLWYSKKFRKENFLDKIDYYDKNGMLLEEKEFQIGRDNETIFIRYTYYVVLKLSWAISFLQLGILMLKQNILMSILLFIITIVLHITKYRLWERWVISKISKELSESIYDDLISKKYNL